MKKAILGIPTVIMFLFSFLILAVTAGSAMASEDTGYNLSAPAIFAEGCGLGGIEIKYVNNLPTGLGIPGLPGLEYWVNPHCYYGIVNGAIVDYKLYLQGEGSIWQADWVNGKGLNWPNEDLADGKVHVTVDWSDNLLEGSFSEKSVIPVAIALYYENEKHEADSTDPMAGKLGYKMMSTNNLTATDCETTALTASGDSDVVITSDEVTDEIWGTTGAKKDYAHSTAFSVCARLRIDKLKCYHDECQIDPAVPPMYDSFVYEKFSAKGQDDSLAVAIDGPGKFVYMYNWNLAAQDKYLEVYGTGKYRLTFSLNGDANCITGDKCECEEICEQCVACAEECEDVCGQCSACKQSCPGDCVDYTVIEGLKDISPENPVRCNAVVDAVHESDEGFAHVVLGDYDPSTPDYYTYIDVNIEPVAHGSAGKPSLK